MTPHINAAAGSFADTVLMPGDPLRAKHIAENYLDDISEVTNVRNMLGYTGFYKGHRVSVMDHGMGIPSVAIYAYELIHVYGVKNLIRVGSCGGVAENLNVRDLVVATGASTASATNRDRQAKYDYSATPDFELLKNCWQTAEKQKFPVRYGNIFSNDLFYGTNPNLLPAMQRMGILAVEMEAAAMFAIAAEARARALCILTVSDHLTKTEVTTAEERQSSFHQMVELSLETAIVS